MHMMYVLFAGYEALVGPEMRECLDKVKIVKSKLDQATRLENEDSIITFMRGQFASKDIEGKYWIFFRGLIDHKIAIKNDIIENEKNLLEKYKETRTRRIKNETATVMRNNASQ